MKIKEYNGIRRVDYPRWAGWKLLDFYNSVNLNFNHIISHCNSECRDCSLCNEHSEYKIIKILEDNFILVKNLESKIRPEV